MKGNRVHIAGMAALLVGLAMPLSVQAAQENTTLEKAQQAFDQRADPEKAKASLQLYQEAAKENPGSYEARWEGARDYTYYLAYPFSNGKKEEKTALAQKGIDLAKEAVKLKRDGVEAHYWLGALYGIYGESKGILKSLSLVPKVANEMNLCLREDPSVDCYGPDRVLGRMYYKLPWFAGGNNRRSLRYLKASVEKCPDNDLSRLYLAETCKAVGKDQQAREQLEKIINQEPAPRWAPSYPYIKAKAEKVLKEIG